MHINKSLKTRCKAIQQALKKFNEAAKDLGWLQLDWKDISSYKSLAEFELLRECRDDIWQQPWADSANRQAALYALKIESAKEERECLNIEMKTKESLFATTIVQLGEDQSALTIEIQDLLSRCSWQNELHCSRILQIYWLSHFTRATDATLMAQSSADPSATEMATHKSSVHPKADGSSQAHVVESESPDAEEDDQAQDKLDKVNEFLENLGTMGEGTRI
ncbi:hypothetical protein BC834DRAFT_848214 [Gloeopeniophorella convolvens]|nr:hypothetical protein BC834DRAFT_848214 [Gloeopeniophorella convolvens]